MQEQIRVTITESGLLRPVPNFLTSLVLRFDSFERNR